MVCDFTGMEIANASLLDEATAAAEAMSMACNALRGRRSTFILDKEINPQTVNVVKTRAEPLGLKVKNDVKLIDEDTFAILLQYPNNIGSIEDYSSVVEKAHENGITDIIIDPGFGFGKSLSHNYELLKSLSLFKKINCPILVGISRKSMIYNVINS